MILDYRHNKNKKSFEVSYVDENGNKRIFKIDGINRFKSYVANPNGEFIGDDGEKCSLSYTDNPNKFDLRSFMHELNDDYQEKMNGKKFPKLYVFDIENEFEKGTSADPVSARGEVTTISVVDPNFNTIVLGTRKLNDVSEIEKKFLNNIENNSFYKTLYVPKRPTFRYFKFDNEKEMLRYFLEQIVANAPVLAGWNSILYDWQYIVNRIHNNYPELSVKMASITKTVHTKMFDDYRFGKVKLPVPDHTVLVDLMDVVKSDRAILKVKESLTLDYIAHETVGSNKVEYEGDLMDLYESNFDEYVYYNTIDSVLVQLINYRFNAMDIYCMYSIVTRERLGDCFSKIALTEALVADVYENRNVKILHHPKSDEGRGVLVGAYVREASPGLWEWVVGRDFSALYPSSGRTCDISFENIVEGDWTEEELERFRNDKRYFVSVLNTVYDVTKDSIFKTIWDDLTAKRYSVKYIPKKIRATVLSDIEHILNKHSNNYHIYDDEVKKVLKDELGLFVESGNDFLSKSVKELENLKLKIENVAIYLYIKEQAFKNLSNSMYGGSSHISFYWYNMKFANDITGEARNTIHLMEDVLQNVWKDNWANLKSLHNKLGITVDERKVKELLNENWKPIIYGDTDSLYAEFDTVLKTIVGYEKLTDEEKFNIVKVANEEFLDGYCKKYLEDYFAKRNAKSVHNFEMETITRRGVWPNVKKHYAKSVVYDDGKINDFDNLPISITGFECVQSSTPKLARKQQKEMLNLLLTNDDKYLIQKMNLMMQRFKQEFMTADVEDISGSQSVNKYKEHIIDDKGEIMKVKKGCVWQSRALALYNWLINTKHLEGENIYGGKLKFYITKNAKNEFFAYQSKRLPKWAEKYAPIDRVAMFERTVVNPMNRILSDIGMPQLQVDGNIQLSMF